MKWTALMTIAMRINAAPKMLTRLLIFYIDSFWSCINSSPFLNVSTRLTFTLSLDDKEAIYSSIWRLSQVSRTPFGSASLYTCSILASLSSIGKVRLDCRYYFANKRWPRFKEKKRIVLSTFFDTEHLWSFAQWQQWTGSSMNNCQKISPDTPIIMKSIGIVMRKASRRLYLQTISMRITAELMITRDYVM